MDVAEKARDEFRVLVQSWSSAMLEDTTATADLVNRRADALFAWVDRLDDQGAELARNVLTPFLADDDPATRCAAASFLLGRGGAERAVPVLEELADNYSYGSVSSQAAGALLGWRREQRKASSSG
jgi:HEAT repeat protein